MGSGPLGLAVQDQRAHMQKEKDDEPAYVLRLWQRTVITYRPFIFYFYTIVRRRHGTLHEQRLRFAASSRIILTLTDGRPTVTWSVPVGIEPASVSISKRQHENCALQCGIKNCRIKLDIRT